MNKRYGGLLLFLISVQFGFGVCFLTWSILKPSMSLRCLVSCGRTHVAYSGSLAGHRSGSIQGLHLPTLEVRRAFFHQCGDFFRCGPNLDHTFPCTTSHCDVVDLVAFSLIFVTARATLPRAGRYTGIPSILGIIVRDATLYFIVMFFCQLLLESFLLFAPVCNVRYCEIAFCSPHTRRIFSSRPECKL